MAEKYVYSYIEIWWKIALFFKYITQDSTFVTLAKRKGCISEMLF